MLEVENIRDWLGHDVVDSEGSKIGVLESVYVDTATDLPAFAALTVGLPTRKRITFVPLTGASVSPSHLRVAWPKQVVKDAPSIDTDGELAADEELPLFAHYKLDYGTGGARRLARR
ncbi:PRC-barrel domain-containing protein [Streptomyces sp. NPDC087440]|uniref:PRC-barrel domain-containing protein n=1 Tax=Streptomyces sp. NPDC087440 TaxID=3365790 RepID=UPI003825BDD7